MGKTIAAKYRLPYGPTGIKVSGAKLSNGTIIKDLRVVKQRSSKRFDLLDVNTNTVHYKISMTGMTSTGVVLDPSSTDDTILASIGNGTFFIKVLDEADEAIGFSTKFYNNVVHMSNKQSFFIDGYDFLYVPVPEITPPVYELDGAKAAFSKVGKPNELMVGSGNSNLSMVTASDGIIQLALAARLWQPSGTGTYTSVVPPVDGVYTIKMDKSKNQEYTLPFSVGVVSPEFIGKITDLYGVTITFYGNNQGLMTSNFISWRLELINGKLVFKDYKYGRDITDSAVTPQLTAIQNITRYKFFDEYLEIAPPPGEIPTGRYVGTIVARNLVTNDVLELKVVLDASYL